MVARLSDIRDAIRRAWPHAWTEAGCNERLDAPEGSPRAWRPWWSPRRLRSSAAGLRRWGGQSYNERLADHQRKQR